MAGLCVWVYLDAAPPARVAPVAPSAILQAEMANPRFWELTELRRAGRACLLTAWRIMSGLEWGLIGEGRLVEMGVVDV